MCHLNGFFEGYTPLVSILGKEYLKECKYLLTKQCSQIYLPSI